MPIISISSEIACYSDDDEIIPDYVCRCLDADKKVVWVYLSRETLSEAVSENVSESVGKSRKPIKVKYYKEFYKYRSFAGQVRKADDCVPGLSKAIMCKKILYIG